MPLCQSIADDRALISISGAQASEFLQNLITQDVDKCTDELWRAGALLTAQGKLAFDFLIRREGERFLIDCDKRASDAFVKKLTLYRLRAEVAIETLPHHLLIVWGDGAFDKLARDGRHNALGWRDWSENKSDMGFDEKPYAEWQAHRISCGVPQGIDEMPSGAVFPLEFGFGKMGAIDFDKGCFIGQEVCSRVERKGALRKELWVVEGARALGDITSGERNCGEVVALGSAGALALIRKDALALPLQAEGQSLRVLGGLFD